jgi:hypothetical protein
VIDIESIRSTIVPVQVRADAATPAICLAVRGFLAFLLAGHHVQVKS